MGVGIGMGIGSYNSSKTRMTIKNADGSTAATITITKPAKKKTKRLPYNFKKVSSQIMMSKTSTSARKAVTLARGTLVMLLRKVKTGEYDDKELENAIIHARKMERIARKRMKHMQQEERAKQSGTALLDLEEYEESESETEETGGEQDSELSEEELEELMQELQEFMKEFQEESLQELADELLASVPEDVDPEELERLKKKHRSEEFQEIVKADMEYLKALFDKLEKEKQSSSSGSSSQTSSSASDLSGVSLELAGVDIPVEADIPVEMAEGGTLDVMV